MKHIAAISRVPAAAQTTDNLQFVIDMLGFFFELMSALQTAITTVLDAALTLKENTQE